MSLVKYSNSRFFCRVAMLATGTVVSQLVTLIAAPVLSRIYSPDDFGVLGLFMAIATPLAIISCMRYEMAIMLPEKDSPNTENLLVLSILISVLISGIFFIIFVFGKKQISGLLGNVDYSDWLLWIPLVVLLHGVYLAFRVYALRNRRMSLIAASSLSHTSSQSIVQIFSGFILKCGSSGLIWGQIAGRIVSTVMISLPSSRQLFKRIVTVCSLDGILKAAKRYKDFPLYQSWGVLLNSFSRGWIILLIGFFFDGRIVGLYFMGFRLLNLPLRVIGGAIGDVFFEKGVREHNAGAADTIVKVTRILCLMTLPISVAFLLLAPAGFELFLGPEWREAGIYLQILTPMFAFRFISGPIARAFTIYEKQRAGLMWQIGNLFISCFSISIGGMFGSIFLALSLYSAMTSMMYFIMLLLCLKYAGSSLKDVFLPIRPVLNQE